MWSVPNTQDKNKGADVVLSTNHVNFLINKLSRPTDLPTPTIFVSGTSSFTAILKHKSVNPIKHK